MMTGRRVGSGDGRMAQRFEEPTVNDGKWGACMRKGLLQKVKQKRGA